MYYKRKYGIPFKIIAKISGVKGYLLAARLFAWVCGQEWVQGLCWKNESAIIRRFLLETGIATNNSEIKVITQRALMFHIWSAHWRDFLNNASTSQLEKLVNITGLSNFQNAHDKGKGVLFVHYHSAATDLFWPCFSLHHHEIGIFIGRATKLPNKYKKDETLRVEGKNDPNLLFKYVKQLKQAQETLKEGGIIHLLPDGLAGTRGTPKILHNRTRNFQPGFVELALQEQVPILPACTFFDLRGKLHVKIFEPFDFGPEAMSDEEKKNMLIDQYVDYLHKCWQEQPWNTPVHLMNRHLDLPLAGGSGSPGI